VRSDSVESGGGGEDSGGGGSESLGSGESTEALGGNWCGWGSNDGEGGEAVGPGTCSPCELEVLLAVPGTGSSRSNEGAIVTEGPEGDDGDHWDGVGVQLSSSDCSSGCGCTRVVVIGITDVSRGVGTGVGGAHPFVVPDLTHGEFVAICGVTDGTEGFTPSFSESEDLGGEGSPTTDGLGGSEVGEDSGAGWLGGLDKQGLRIVPCHSSGLDGSLLDVTGISGWLPWHVWKWWNSWGFWWAEGGGEGVLFAVLLEDGNVGIPGGLGGVVSGEGGAVLCLNVLTLGVYGGWDLGWEESDLSEIEAGSCADGTVGGGGWGSRCGSS